MKLWAPIILLLMCACATNRNHAPTFLATKTPYLSAQSIFSDPTGCRVVHVEGVFRHGSRYATDTKSAEQLILLLETKQSVAMLSKAERLALEWAYDALNLDAGMLTTQGAREMQAMGQRFAFAYKDLLAHSKTVETLAAPKERARASLKHFLQGLTRVIKVELKESAADPKILRYFAHCKRYRDYLEASRPPLPKSTTKFEDLVYKLCQQDFNVDATSGGLHFCSLLSADALESQYEAARQKSYHKFGPLTDAGMACQALEPMFSRMERAVHGEKVPAAHLAFAHAETVVPLANFFELFDVPLSLWNTSDVAPMGANLQLITYACDGADQAKHFVKLLYNEKEIAINAPECRDVTLCPWEVVKSYYQKRKERLGVKKCTQRDWDTHCGNEKT